MGIAFQVERVVFITANCVWGAELMLGSAAHALCQLLPRQISATLQRALDDSAGDGPGARRARAVRSAATLLVATGGAYYQFLDGVDAALPVALRAALFAPLLFERWLQTATLTVRGPLSSLAQSAGPD